MQKATAVLCVEEIESVLPFWMERLGFEKVAEVPHGDWLGFVILKRGGVELMYQTRASIADDIAVLTAPPTGGTMLFIKVDDLDAVERALKGVEPLTPRRKTFYGADELIVREPGGNVVNFAHFPAES